MKIHRFFSALFLAIALLLVNVSTAFALPPLPSSFWGTVKLDGANVPLGTVISARINGIQYATTTVTTYYLGDTLYTNLKVPGDDPATPVVEGGVVGDTVVFYVGSYIADQTAPWQTGTNIRLDLTASTPPTCYALTLSHTGQGSNPVASPANSTGCSTGQYLAGATINLSGAVPTSGWQISSWTGTTNNASTASTNTATMPASAHTVAVNYTAIPTHTVTYANGGGTGTPPTQAPVAQGATFTVAANTFTRAGFTFAGWHDGTNPYAAGATYTMGTSNVTLTAQWTALGSFTVIFDANGGTGTMAPQVSNVAANLTLNSFTRAGYSFNGWNTNADGTSGTNYANGASYPFTANVTLYAKWTALPSYTVTFNSNGGTGTMAPQISNVAANLTLNTFTRAGYSFNGWNTNADGTSGTNYANGASYPFTANVTLYAKWSTLPNHTVTFNSNGGSGSMSNQVANVPTALTLNTFTRAGYNFAGWNTNAGGTGTPYANGAVYSFAADVTLYAQWSTLPNHTVTFNSNGGSGSMSNQVANVPTALTLNTFTRTGYSFSGWNTQANGLGTNYANGAVYSFSADITLYAKWSALPSCYALTLNHTGQGTDPAATPSNSTGCTAGQYIAGASISLSGAVPTSGWQIGSWTGTNNNASTTSTNTVTMPASAHTASVNYTQTEYILTVNTVGSGTVTRSNPGPYHLGDVVTLTPVPAAGWSFSAWSGACTGSGACSVTMDANKTVTATFTQNENIAPVANAQSVSTNEDTAKAITLTGTDADGDTLTYTIVSGPSHGSLSGTAPNVTYTPAANYNGSDSFTFKVNDGKVDSAPATVSITVTAANNPPTDISISKSNIDENQAVNALVGSLSTTDPDAGDTFTYSFCGGTDDASFAISGNSLQSAVIFDYETKNSYSICIRSTDGGALSTTKTITITVNNLVDTQTFADVPPSYWAYSFIERLYSAGITGGCGTSPLIYCPDATATRAQMAVFLLRGMHGPSYTPPAATGTVFTDVAQSYWAAAWIEQLTVEGITGGCGTGIYCPDATVTRAQVAVFLLKAKHGSSYSPPNATGVFTDVPVGYWAAAWIEQLTLEGITGGCGVGTYCPDADLTRAQMAVFLVKTFNLP